MMMRQFLILTLGLAVALSTLRAHAQTQLPATPLALATFADFNHAPNNWHLAAKITGDAATDTQLQFAPGTGTLVNSGQAQSASDLSTQWQHGDLDLDFDYLLAPDARPEVLLQGRYAVPLAREFSRAPGLWQHIHLEFRTTPAPHLNQVALNDFVTDRNITLTANGSGPQHPGPLVFTGNHGSYAIRNLTYKRYSGERTSIDNLKFSVFSGRFTAPADYASLAPKRTGTSQYFDTAITDADGRAAVVFTGTLNAPKSGDYLFTATETGVIQLSIDGQTVMTPSDQGGHPGQVTLTAGPHTFRLDCIRTIAEYLGLFRLSAEGPEVEKHVLNASPNQKPLAVTRTYPVEPHDRILAQRGFVQMPGTVRLYAISVGNPAGVHYAYDLESAAILKAWRGTFIDTSTMWINRGGRQQARATGPALILDPRPGITVLNNPADPWPEHAGQIAESRGYTLEKDGQPVFHYRLAGVNLDDRISPSQDRHNLTRHMHFEGELWDGALYILLAEASQITPRPGGYLIGDHLYYLNWPADAPLKPQTRENGTNTQLIVRLPEKLPLDLQYTLVW